MRQLSGVDALHIIEETRNQHMHTIKLAILGPQPEGGPVPESVIREWAQERVPSIPAFRWKVLKIPYGLGRPVFIDAGPYDVNRHIDVRNLDAPGSDAQLDEVISEIASTQVDRSRPLWDLTIITGLSGDRVALVFKIHHAIADGQASVRFFELAFDGGDPNPYGDLPVEAEAAPTRAELVRFAVTEQAKLYGQAPKVLARSIAAIRQNIAHKKAGAPPVVNPMSGPNTRFNKLPLPERVYVDVTVPFADVKALRVASGRTINELFVTICGGAIRRYLEEKNELPDRALISAHPVSLRQPDERDNFGNRTSYWYVSLGTDVADPLERLHAVKASLDAAKGWAQGDTELFSVWQDYYLIFGVMTLKSLALAEKLSKRPAFNAVVSNVRGPGPISLGRAPVVAVRSMGPITRTLGLNMTAWSYGPNFSVGIHSCRAFLDDPQRLGELWREELAALSKAIDAEPERAATA